MRLRADREQDLERELRSHLELASDEYEEIGLSPEEARRAARMALGNTTKVKEEVREMWSWARLNIVVQDVRHSMRTLRKSSGFATTAFLTLALGIGASTAVFTVVDSVILRPLAYRDSGSLVVLWERVGPMSPDPTGPNPRHADLWRKQATAFRGLALTRQRVDGITLGTDHPRVVGTVIGTANLFEVLQVAPLLGRGFLPEDDVPGHDNVAMLSYPLWQSLFQGDPNVVGRTIRLGDTRREVIGVLPAGFRLPDANALRAFHSRQPVSGAPEPAVYIPAAFDLSKISWNGMYGNWVALARLKPGIDIKQAEAQLAPIEAQIEREMPAGEKFDRPGMLRAFVQPMQEAVVGSSRTGLWLLMAAVMSLMFIACMNLANAQLGRALSRQREAAVCSALGAAKWRLVWNSLAENLLLAAAGGAAAPVLGGLMAGLIASILAGRLIQKLLYGTQAVEPAVTLIVIVLFLVAAIAAAFLPARRAASVDPMEALRSE